MVTVREVRRNVQNGTANRPGQQGVQGTERPAGGGAQQRHTGQQVERVNRAGGSVANGGSQQRHDLGGATSADLATPGCSSDGSLNNERMARGQNVTFFKAGSCHKRGIAGKKRRHNASLGSCRPAPARGSQAEQRSITETITLESDSSDNESL